MVRMCMKTKQQVLEISEPSESTEEIFWGEEYILQSPHRGSAVD
jgi:hypothetical protein